MNPFSGLPNVGDRIAFKVFEMSENYTPAMSDYKFGEVKESCSQQNKVTIKLDKHSINTGMPIDGKFEMPDYDSLESHKDTQQDEKSFHWSEIYEPRKEPVL